MFGVGGFELDLFLQRCLVSIFLKKEVKEAPSTDFTSCRIESTISELWSKKLPIIMLELTLFL